jgi:hypothetical protein
MSYDLYTVLAQCTDTTEHHDHQFASRGDRLPPHTVFTESIETIDNDYASHLLGGLTLGLACPLGVIGRVTEAWEG